MVQFEDSLFAPLFWGFIAAILLTGVTVVQAYVYFNNGKDRPLVQWTALLMLLMDIVSTALLSQSVYYYLIPNFGSFSQFEALTIELDIDCLISAIITFISQLYFARQLNAVRKVGNGQMVALWVTIITAFLGFVGGLGCVTMMFMHGKSVLGSEGRSVAFSVFFSLAKGWAAIADITATLAMCLWLTNSKTGVKETNSLIHELMKYTMQRGVLVTAIQVLVLVCFWAIPHNLAWFALHMSVTKLYVNTFFAMLNGRDQLREKHSAGVVSSANRANYSLGVTSIHGNTQRGNDGEQFTLEKMGNYSRHSEDGSEPEYRSKPVAMPMITRTVVVAEV